MTPTTLQALRRLLFFTQPEAAALIGGVTERSWKYWEQGARSIPADVIERIGQLVAWRQNAIQTASATIAEHLASAPSGVEIVPPALIWYASIEDWMTLPDREPVMWRPQCSVIAELCALHGAVAVPFDAPAYAAWLGKQPDSESMRSQWAASTSTSMLPACHAHPRSALVMCPRASGLR
ncbi:MAG TPA: DUF1870 family protein [Noviherbaspirillum sp.]|nr:DUF1870 family protein [Noviherbaspirillum sp.]